MRLSHDRIQHEICQVNELSSLVPKLARKVYYLRSKKVFLFKDFFFLESKI